MLYAIFENDFIQTKREFEGREVWWDRRKLDGKYDEGFWHIISSTDSHTKERYPDFRRAERLPWCGPTISNSIDPVVKKWDYREGSGRVRTYLWLENWDYVIVLEKRPIHIGEAAFLITAYYVSGDSTRHNLMRKYNNRMC
jgi:hypothetical protein